MTDYTNYGTVLYKMSVSGSGGSATEVASVVKIDPPSLEMPMINTTNHSSGSFASQIPQGVASIDDFDVTLSYTGSTVSDLYDYISSGSLGYYQIAFRNGEKCSFDSYVTKWTPEGTDSQSPEMSMVTLTFSPTGTMIMS